ncbi:hypothetical protein GOBAR_AA06081 [Gossypium barbadense]|uniref:Aminotransferase-like plant mobile domain-containing protein n=1 Tax=Gossypium barbadense TaxID=3634 RepID=A0A2P5YG15_GOSBA|nr:hypothetical protein GOBAR_AA06081 [Gossypium barbadense]
MTGPPSPLIENYLREAGFWHVAMIGRGSYILQIIGGYLMPGLSRNLVHLRWLLKLVDFRAAGEFSWGSAVLETLYREMCGTTRLNKAKIGGCLLLLQSWAQFRFPFLHLKYSRMLKIYLIRCNHLASYARLPTCLEDIRLLLENVIPDEYLQNPNAWHVKVPLVNFAIVEMHQSDRVLRQFGFRQPIPMAPEVLDDHHKIDLRQLHTDWPRFWSHYIQMWEDRYDYIPTREPIIVPELACVPEYMPWFRIHGKPYLLSEEERQRQLRVQRKQRGPLNPRRKDDDAGPSIASTQSLGPATGPTQSPGPTVQLLTPTVQPLQMMPGTYPSPFMYPSPYMFPFSSPMAGWNAWPGSSPFPITLKGPSGSSSSYQSPSPYGFQTPPPLMMQTPPQSLFYQGGLSSQHPQPESSPEQAQPLPEAGQRRNPTRNCRRPPCGTESDRYEL